MILKYLNCFKLNRFDFIFPQTYLDHWEIYLYYNQRFKKSLCLNNFGSHVEYSFPLINVWVDYLQINYNIDFQRQQLQMPIKYWLNGYIFGPLFVYGNQLYAYFDRKNNEIIINEKLSIEIKNLLVNQFYEMKTFNNSHFYIKIRFGSLNVSSRVIIKRYVDFNAIIANRMFHVSLSYFSQKGDQYFYFGIPIQNSFILPLLKIQGRCSIHYDSLFSTESQRQWLQSLDNLDSNLIGLSLINETIEQNDEVEESESTLFVDANSVTSSASFNPDLLQSASTGFIRGFNTTATNSPL